MGIRNILKLDKVRERSRALDIKADGITPLRWERYEKIWRVVDDKYLPLYAGCGEADGALAELSGAGNRQIEDFILKIYEEKAAKADFLKTILKFPHMGFDNLILLAACAPEASAVKRYEEWERYGRKVSCPGIYFYRFDTAGEEAEAILKKICRGLDKREYQRVGRFYFRKGGSGNDYDVLKASYQARVETLALLCASCSRKEVKKFIEENIAGKEIDAVKQDRALFPDTATVPIGNQAHGKAYGKAQERHKGIGAERLYAALRHLCIENHIDCGQGTDGEGTGNPALRLLESVTAAYVPRRYQDIVMRSAGFFYGIFCALDLEEAFLEEKESYREKREALRHIKMAVDFIVYNIKASLDGTYEEGDGNGGKAADGEGGPEGGAAGPPEKGKAFYGEKAADKGRLATQPIKKLYELPEDIGELEGIYLNPGGENEILKIGLSHDGMQIWRKGKSFPFSLPDYNAMAEEGYEKAVADTEEEPLRLLAVMEEDGEEECDYLIAEEECGRLLCGDLTEEERESFQEALAGYGGSGYVNARTRDGKELYVFPVRSVTDMLHFMEGAYREYNGMACYFSAGRTSRMAAEEAVKRNVYIWEYDDEEERMNWIPVHEDWRAEIRKEGGRPVLYLNGVKKELRERDLIKLEKINGYFAKAGLPALKGSGGGDQPLLRAGTVGGGTVSFYSSLKDAIAAYRLIPASARKNIILQIGGNEKTRKGILKNGKTDRKAVESFGRWIDGEELEIWIRELEENFKAYGSGRTEEPVTPAEKKWIDYNKIGEYHNVTVCLWQPKAAYRDRYRGVPYKILHDIYKEKVLSARYEKKIELTLRSCENLKRLRDSFYYQVFIESPEEPVLAEYFTKDGLIPIAVGDLIEIYSIEDKIYSLSYVDTRGFAEIARNEYYCKGEADKKMSEDMARYKRGYGQDRVLATALCLKVDERTARVINAIPASVLRLPETEEEFSRYRKTGIALAGKILKQIDSAPVLICNRCISMLLDDEKKMQQDEPEKYQRMQEKNLFLRKGNVLPFKKFTETVNAYQKAAAECAEEGLYEGYDTIDFMIFGSGEKDGLYAYFSSMKVSGEEYRPACSSIKRDMNLQYRRLREEYKGRRLQNGEEITAGGRAEAYKEMECCIQMAKAVNKALSEDSRKIFGALSIEIEP